MIYFQEGSDHTSLTQGQIREGLFSALDKLGRKNRVLVVPPDFTRFHSRAGEITTLLAEYYRNSLTDILPALGTHAPMTSEQIETMFPGIPANLFRIHDWRKDVLTLGRLPSDFVRSITGGQLTWDWPVQLNRLVCQGGHDLIISVGQVVPHEVIGMANYTKNLLVGTGGSESINKSHFMGAVYGMEKIMGRADNPVRKLLNRAATEFLNGLPVLYIHTVVARDKDGNLAIRGLFIGDDEQVFTQAAALSQRVNFSLCESPLKKMVVYLDPAEYRTTWLGNKSIYRTRMAIANGGELIVLAPGVGKFGEDGQIDSLIRKYGYRGTLYTLQTLKRNSDLLDNLSAAAHLIHGSTEGRFTVTYCPGHLSREEVESVNFNYAPLKEMQSRYNPEILQEGFNQVAGGEEIFFISNPALGLWSTPEKLTTNN